MKAGREYSALFLAAASLVSVVGCFAPDPRTVAGALDYAVRATEARDARKLFKVLDQQARHALDGTVKMRAEAARIIRETYPADQVASALAELGDAANAATSPELFAQRCDAACLDWFSAQIGGPLSERRDGELVHVRTIRDTQLTLRHGSDGWYGIVWHTEELAAERDRAARDLAQVEENARVYSARKRLEPSR